MNNNWQHRIQQHTALPPEALWDRIAIELDRADNQGVSERLQQYQAIPPEEIWEQIAQHLPTIDETRQAPVTATNHTQQATTIRKFNWIKLGAAAGILLLLGSSMYWYVLRQSPGIEAGNSTSSTNLKQQGHSPVATQKDVIATLTPKTGTSKKTVVQSRKQVTLKIDSSLLLLLPAQGGAPIHATPTIDLAVVGDPKHTDIAIDGFPAEINQPYFTITGPDGEMVRVSSKLKNIAPLLSERDPANEENIDLIIKNSAGWKLKLKHWKDRMLQIPFTPSPTNLMNIIELGKMLDEQEK
ncbi:MAG: hypothetical protein RLY16_546 [Bacteroidota bacterium]